MKEGYIGGPTGGVPERLFSHSNTQIDILGESGAVLKCFIRPEICTIRVEGETTTRFGARVLGSTLSLDIHNKGATNEEPRHPDIYAKKLVERYVGYAEEHGIQVDSILGGWSKTSDNYKEFEKHLAETTEVGDEEITLYAESAAAKETWTGRLAQDLGYTETRVLNDWRNEGFVRVSFKRD